MNKSVQEVNDGASETMSGKQAGKQSPKHEAKGKVITSTGQTRIP